MRSVLALGWLMLFASGNAIAGCSAALEPSEAHSPDGQDAEGGEGAILGEGEPEDRNSFDGDACGTSSYASLLPATVLVVLDRSGSMSGESGVASKWEPTVAALGTAMDLANPILEMGLLPFPAGNFDDSGLAACALNMNSTTCKALFADGGCEDVDPEPVIPIGPLSTNKPLIEGWLSTNGPTGGTPTLFALEVAYDILRGTNAEGDRYVLLMTDGAPNTYDPGFDMGPLSIPESNVACGELEDIESETLEAFDGIPSIKTFVVGSPGSEDASGFLSMLAVNGGTSKSEDCIAESGECHYQIGSANFQSDLEAALAAIAGEVTDCVFELELGENADPEKVNVAVETASGELQLYRDESHIDGWDYEDEAHAKIRIYGPSCDTYKKDESAKVTIVVGCATLVR